MFGYQSVLKVFKGQSTVGTRNKEQVSKHRILIKGLSWKVYYLQHNSKIREVHLIKQQIKYIFV